MADIPIEKRSEMVQITGDDELYSADVKLIDGKKKLLTDASITVEQINSFDDFADVWAYINNAGLTNDTIRIQIAAYVDPTSTERNIPATDKTITVTALEAQKEIVLRDKIINELNADSNFKLGWKASAIKDNAILHISSIFIGEYGERLNVNDFQITTTGTVSIQRAFDNIKRRGKQNSGTRDARDKRVVTFGISGSVTSTQEAFADIEIENALNSGSPELNVNGSLVSPVIFTIPAVADHDIIITEMRFYGHTSGIKFGQFLNLNVYLANGIKVEIKSNDDIETLPLIKGTGDLQSEFALGQIGFQLLVGAGPDSFLSSFKLQQPFSLKKVGSFTINDYIKVYIQDNLTAIGRLRFMAFGYRVEA